MRCYDSDRIDAENPVFCIPEDRAIYYPKMRLLRWREYPRCDHWVPESPWTSETIRCSRPAGHDGCHI
jgi:hypothetical protein